MSHSARMDLRGGERGAVKIKTLLAFAVLAVAVFVVIKVVPVYVEQRQVIYEIDELARTAAIRSYKADKINKDIEKLLRDFDLPPSSVNYEPSDRGVQITVGYQRDIDFLVTTWVWRVDHKALGKDL
ncbi:MAG: hypothetical protein L0229_00760 [Blastocatellia bacterium]|nr:hypothetical protein [Blastocatellia bacterium]